ncbi:MFS general substrate transporter [Rhizopus microsporus var. microsporus]|uniref:MFS general substrate transporter n=2 Tax=Rhizopus microsporus TaxID=58291 RepID=A0A2G4TAG4_RHIZD|nr:MFS general substrate transporter [Rhizopus microsporus ATCC 52813]ORE10645.1 MFS general substrate transporter [Rhizopus microsporus var. microsporus]PHZ18000.1 MFS general substrate transporter [Rhizopus microsporus ATCC 52813]
MVEEESCNKQIPSQSTFSTQAVDENNSIQSNSAEKNPNDEDSNSISKKSNILWTFIGLQIALFLAALDGTIVATALPTIGSDFNSMSIVSWVATAYILTFDSFQPLFSKFSDIFGRKWILMFGIVVFLIGSLLCAVSTSIVMLIVFRAIAGIGAAAVFSMVFVVVADLVPLEKRASYQGIINAVFGVSSVCGPLIGGSFTDYVTWRWNFYINLPIGAVAMVMIFFFLHLPMPKEGFIAKLKRIDFVGTFIVLAFSTLFLLAMNFGGQTFPWKSAAVIVPLVLTVILVAILYYVETKVAEPLMPPRLFKNRSVAAVLLTNWFLGMTFFSMLYYLPIYFQVVRGDSATWSGIRLIPMQLFLSVFATVVGFFISKSGIYKPLPPIGMALLTICVGLLSILDLDSSFSKVYGFTIIGGFALGFVIPAAIIALQASVEPKDIAVVTGLGNFSRILGGALGVAISSAILNTSLAQDLALYIPADIVNKILDSSNYVRNGCPPEYLEIVLKCYVDAIRLIWYVMVGMSGFGFCLSCLIKTHSIRKPKEPKEQNTSAAPESVIIDVEPKTEKQDENR